MILVYLFDTVCVRCLFFSKLFLGELSELILGLAVMFQNEEASIEDLMDLVQQIVAFHMKVCFPLMCRST